MNPIGKRLRVLALLSVTLVSFTTQAERLKGANKDTEGLDAPELYHEFCSVCHGDRGQRAMWAQGGLDPQPVDFTSSWAKENLTRERMILSATYGRANTAMVGWGQRLSRSQIEGIVDYIRREFMGIKDEEKVVIPEVDMTALFPKGLQGDLNKGAAIYMVTCATCHGPYGDGRGPRAFFINPKPRNFVHSETRAKFNRPKLFEAISMGENGTEMPAWSKVLSDQQIADVAEFVFQTFIQP